MTGSKIKFFLSLYYNGNDSYLYFSGIKIYEFDTLDNIPRYYFYLGVSKDFTNNDVNEISLKDTAYGFSTDYDLIGAGKIVNIHEDLIK